MEEQSNMGGWRVLIATAFATCGKLGFDSFMTSGKVAVPDDSAKILAAVISAFIMALIWFIIRAVQQNSMKTGMIAGAMLITFVFAPTIIQWAISAIQGNFSLGVDMIDAALQDLTVLIGVVVAKFFTNKKRYEEFFANLGFTLLDD